MLIKSVKNKDYGLLVDKIKINMEQGYIVSRLKNSIPENFYQDSNDKLWYFKNYKKNTKLIDIFYPDIKIQSIEFKNNDYNDYLPDNLVIKLDQKYENSFFEPPNYTIIEKGLSVLIKEGSCAGEYRNMYWKVKDSQNDKYYVMHIKDNLYTKISKRDINKVLTFGSNNIKINFRPTWRLFQNGYICCTINNGIKQKTYYLHQLIMDVHDEDLTNMEKTVDHINQDKLDNRRTNLRLVNMSIQNANRSKPERRFDACELPDGIQQTDLPKYAVYRKEILDKDTGNFREYFYICNHPDLDKNWETTKSQKVTIREKLKQVKLKLQELNGDITQKQYMRETNTENKIDLPVGIRLNKDLIPHKFIFDLRKDNVRYGLNCVLKSNDLQKELDVFIDIINNKYPDIKYPQYQIANIKQIKQINETNVSHQKQSDTVKLVLPPNFSFYFEAKSKSYYFSFSKSEKGIKIGMKKKINTNNIQNEFDNFIKLVNDKYQHISQPNFTIDNTDNIIIYKNTIDTNADTIDTNADTIDTNADTMDTNADTIDTNADTNADTIDTNADTMDTNADTNTDTNASNIKPSMPANFSICNVNSIDYIQFCKKINDKRYQYKTKINSYDLNLELNHFINELNEKYNLQLVKSDFIITNTNKWQTSNKIIDHSDTEIKLKQRAQSMKYLEKKKLELGENEFHKQKAQYSKQYRFNKLQ